MPVVLGIDAAWTVRNPSGVALVEKDATGWRLVAAEASYSRFMAFLSENQLDSLRPVGSPLNVPDLLDASQRIVGKPVDLVAVDMPLARTPIVRRRCSDNEVSKHYGARHCSTHSPSAERPGRLSDQMRASFEDSGYKLCTLSIGLMNRSIIEVYPHPAIVELSRAERRLEYKHGKVSAYWPLLDGEQRKQSLLEVWKKIGLLLEDKIRGAYKHLSLFSYPAAAYQWKAAEDVLDAIVCAWVGICALEGNAIPFGDDDSAIWIPKVGI